MNIVGIAGSPTRPSRSTALLRQALAQLEAAGGHSRLIEVADLPAQAILRAEFRDPSLVAAVEAVQAADVVVVATPIYKAAYSGVLKAFLDLLPQDGLQGKQVLVLGTGGSIAHLLALDYALKPVLSALGAPHPGRGLCRGRQFVRGEQGHQPVDAVLQRLARALAPLTADTPALALAA
jgi:FMN reductase